MTSGSLWNYYTDEKNDSANQTVANLRVSNNNTTTSESLEYKTKITKKEASNSRILNTKVVVPLKYLSNFWRSPDLRLINCKTELDLSWQEECVISEILNNAIVPANPPAESLHIFQRALQLKK